MREEGLEFYYEPFAIELQPSFYPAVNIWEDSFESPLSNKIRNITYTPDFVGPSWLIECKGRRTVDFNIKWKILKKLLSDKKLKVSLFLPKNKKDILKSIEIIKTLKKVKTPWYEQLRKNK